MNDDLIRRSDAIGACAYETIECYEARKAIRALPSADRPQGKWIDDEFLGQYRCSECDYYSVDEFDYCPNCGAKMSNASNASNTLETLEKGETE